MNLPQTMAMALEGRLQALVSGDAALMAALHAARAVAVEAGLEAWCLGAGAVRQVVWDHLHDCPPGEARPPDLDFDFDFVYFDDHPAHVADAQAVALQQAALTRALQARHGATPWDAVNQAGVHHWLAARQPPGAAPPAPFRSLAAGIASWPETATCVGVWLDTDGALQVLAPWGLDDLFAGVLRWNPAGPGRAVFEARVQGKAWRQRWPGLRLA